MIMTVRAMLNAKGWSDDEVNVSVMARVGVEVGGELIVRVRVWVGCGWGDYGVSGGETKGCDKVSITVGVVMLRMRKVRINEILRLRGCGLYI